MGHEHPFTGDGFVCSLKCVSSSKKTILNDEVQFDFTPCPHNHKRDQDVGYDQTYQRFIIKNDCGDALALTSLKESISDYMGRRG